MLSALYAIARPSVRPSHRWISQKQWKIVKFSPYGSPVLLFFAGQATTVKRMKIDPRCSDGVVAHYFQHYFCHRFPH